LLEYLKKTKEILSENKRAPRVESNTRFPLSESKYSGLTVVFISVDKPTCYTKPWKQFVYIVSF